ncbi:leucyl aminopeptidase family protein [Pelagibacterium halotolerans]|uniref:Peptidase B n=1 Tax=Pelagibacterium halotolerans (strain DSM 22347 / JCM 15775 / CGMCC 1.7692 / B2) TaxID=1082931 RepID=G4RFS9_PELHB|nr:leucyl aminopeptidase family protein [Pelagibacterium halotolerans]AEQ50093.1 peptidase B [Pelagibacterium halotolerans B2]SEA47786.1 leucyl aminopeptidase [Pelagibacterium halotolerans]
MLKTVPIYCVNENGVDAAGIEEAHKAWAKSNGFAGQSGKLLALPDEAGQVAGYLFGLGSAPDRSALVLGLAAAALPAGTYRLAGDYGDPTLAALGFRLGAYGFDRYTKSKECPTLQLPDGADSSEIENLVASTFIARDLVNIPANDLGPDAFEAWIVDFAKKHGIEIKTIRGDELLAQNFPMVHAVGRASDQAPRLVDFAWGDAGHPKITLVGKGVTFDTGGLNIKPGSSMALMKKDMGGAANVLGLANAIMTAGLKVRLRVLIPVVENSISGNAFRPGDVLASRKGLSVEIGNTDAEGRLILADALALADEESPDLIIDMATLTGAARVALGPDLPPVYARNESFAKTVVDHGMTVDDPLWLMPLWGGYDKLLTSKIADVNHISTGGFAGSITAALFLNRFVKPETEWMHLDIFAWAPEARPGRPFGGTDQAIRALYGALKARYGQ